MSKRSPNWKHLGLLGLLALSGSACRLSDHAVEPVAVERPAQRDWDQVLASPVDLEVEVVISARWAVNLAGLVNLHDPRAKAAGLHNHKYPIILPVGVVRHPSAGDFIVDTGIDQSLAEGHPIALHGPVRSFLRKLEPVESLAQIVARLDLDLHGVLLTHMHFDHVLGLPDLASSVPIFIGTGESQGRAGYYGLLRKTYRALLEGRPALRELDPATGIALDPFPVAIDLLGDGSIWAIPSPGHTPGSVAWLINASSGPVLFVGDNSHTRWGWEHGVEPGTFTDDHEANAESLGRLREFVERYPQTRVYLGHEL